MGSDLYMEQAAFRPRPNRGEWDGDDLLIFRDVFYHGWELVWRGPVTEDNESLIKVMLPRGIPEKPEPGPDELFDLQKVVAEVAKIVAKRPSDLNEQAHVAIDSTMRYVVDWLRARGNEEEADTLAQLGGLE